MSILNNRIYYINGEHRLSGTPSNFQYVLDIPQEAHFDSCCVLSMTIPRSYYLVRDGLNKFDVHVNGMKYSFTIPPGNYNALNFMEVVHGEFVRMGVPITITFSEVDGKYVYRIPASTTVKFVFEAPSRLGLQMGFDEVSVNEYTSWSLGPHTFKSPNVLNFVSTSTLFLQSDMVQDRSSILQEVYSDNSTPFSNLVYNCRFPAMYSKQMRGQNNRVFNFSLVDEHDQEVDLNGHNILVTLLLYQKENLSKLMKAMIMANA